MTVEASEQSGRAATRLQRMLRPGFWKLDERQAQAFACDRASLVIAGPGSGKTRLIVAKVVRLAIQFGPSDVMAVTFSHAAAVEMRARLESAVEKGIAKRVHLNTFHALAAAQIKSARDHPLRKRILLDERSARDMLRRAAAQSNLPTGRIDGAVEAAARLKCSTVETEVACDDEAGRLLRDYQALLLDSNAMDLTDLVRESALAMRAGTLAPYPLKHVMVDEGQDMDRTQLEWLMCHVEAGAIPTLVADEDQSVYGFRAALGHAGLAEFLERAGAERIDLDRNYRGSPEIVDAAALVIEDNLDRFEKTIVATRSPGGLVHLHTHPDEDSQAVRVANSVAGLFAAGKSTALIARTNAELDPLEAALLARELPVSRPAGHSLLHRDYVRRFLAALATVEDDADSEARFLDSCELLRLRRESVATIGRHVSNRPATETPLDAVFDSALTGALPKQDATLLRFFRDSLAAYVREIADAEADELAATLDKHVKNIAAHVMDAGHRRDCLLVGLLAARQRHGSVMDRIKALDRRRDAPNSGISLLTAHSSKGLEFDAVWILNCNDGRFPGPASDEQEERRLFYVSMTRARDQLVFSRIQNRPTSVFVRRLQAKLEARASAAAQSGPTADARQPDSPAAASVHGRQVAPGPVESAENLQRDGLHVGSKAQRRPRVHVAQPTLFAEG